MPNVFLRRSKSEDHKPNVMSKKSRGDSQTVSSTVTASHQDSRGSPPAQRTPYQHPSAGNAPFGSGFRYTTCADVNMNMYPHAESTGGADSRRMKRPPSCFSCTCNGI
ncbi:hypothetical protein DPMN_162056 [Dreissena polymorpha]|uniref:Uncharacterized protein n=1 Tax=Dreissena polymorpha TaxID=45954 RepID=A0A9D4EPX0_DREPO|nr:hypothetical protein DPMN_162056 [Dreissena polymorpha]